MSIKTGKTWILAPLSLSMMLALTGCWFDDGSSTSSSNSAKTDTPKDETPANTTTLTGTAAIGAPLVGANVSLNCAGYNKSNATTTGNTGNWNFAVPTANLPCVVNVAGGTTNNIANTQNLYGLSLGNQTNVNITPLTTLALAGASNNALGLKLEDLFKAANIDFSKLAAQIDAAVNKLKNDLTAQGFNYPDIVDFNPFFTAFDPQAGNSYDDLLEAVMAAIQAANSNLAALTTIYATGGTLPAASTGNNGGNNNNNGGNNNNGNNNGGTTTPANAIGLATFNNYSAANNEAFFNSVKGTYPVAIFRAPAGKESHIGEGSLTISGTAENWSLQLKAHDGTVINALNNKSVIYGALTPAIGKLFLNNGNTPDKHISVELTKSGQITGWAGGFAEYGFRNNVLAYGAALPEIFKHIAGIWRGESMANTCNKPKITVTVKADGSVSNSGKSALGCSDATVENKWNGNDDYVTSTVIDEGSWQSGKWVTTQKTKYIVDIDNAKGGGSQAQGGIRLTLDSLDSKPAMIAAYANLSGGSGAIETINAVPFNPNAAARTEPTAEELADKARLNGKSGITAIAASNVTSKTYTYSKAANTTGITIDGNLIKLQFNSDSLLTSSEAGNWTLAFPEKVGTYECTSTLELAKSSGDSAYLSLNNITFQYASDSINAHSGKSERNTGGACTVTVLSVGNTIEGSFSGKLVGALGAQYTVSQGYFSVVRQ